VKYLTGDMASIAAISEATWHPEAEEPYICLLAGKGEVQMNQDGDVWYFEWETRADEGVTLKDAEALGTPPAGPAHTVAAWFVDQARKFKE
jgi:hypothetical protein